ncbi:hypothetical protein SCLCIDRAFT_56986, partial [Scleroderma citrinum Foug A]
NGLNNAQCGGGMWFADGHPLNRAICVPGRDQLNQTGEIAAVIVALQSVPRNADLTIVTNSQYVIMTITHSLQTYEDSGWTNIESKQMSEVMKSGQTETDLPTKGSAPTSFKWVKGHNADRGNKCADALAAEGA